VGHPLVLLLVDRIVIIVLEVQYDVVIWVAFSSWIVAVRVHLGCDVQVLFNWVFDLESILSLAGVQLFYHVLVWLVNGDGQVVILLNICFEWHPENAIVLLLEANLLLPCFSPVLVVIAPWTLIHFGGPWVT